MLLLMAERGTKNLILLVELLALLILYRFFSLNPMLWHAGLVCHLNNVGRLGKFSEMAIFQYGVCQGKDVSQSQTGKSKQCLISVWDWNSVPPFSGTLLPWAATYLTCVECKCKSWCISQWRTLSSRKEEMRWNNNRNFSYCLRSAVPMKQLKWCHLTVYTLARNEFRRLLWLWRKI